MAGLFKDFMQVALIDLDQALEADYSVFEQAQAIAPLTAHMQTVLGYWLAGMALEHLARMDARIVDKYKADLPRDTALLMLRDYINTHADMLLKPTINVDSGHPVAAYLHINYDPDDEVWQSAIDTVTSNNAYRLCEHCGTPFVYKSKRATYCSDVCRTAASRERRS